MTVKQLRTRALELCKEQGKKSSWVQFSKKRRLLEFINGDYDPDAKDDTPTASGGNDGNQPSNGDGTSPSEDGSDKKELSGLETAIGDYVGKKIMEDGGIQDAIDEYIEERTKEVIAPTIIKVKEKVIFDPADGDLLHYQFTDVLDKLVMFGKVFMHGERGTGKSSIAEQLYKIMAETNGWDEDDKYRYTYVAGTAGVSEAQLLGKSTFDGRYIEGQYVKPFSDGGMIVADEFNGFDPNMALIHNAMLDGQGLLFTPNDPEAPHRYRHDDFKFIAIDNTNGYGNDFSYVGRNQQDSATLDRFTGATVSIGYDPKIESTIVGEYSEVAVALWDLRDRIKNERLNRNISTRAFYTSAQIVAHAVKGAISPSVTPIRTGVGQDVEIGLDKASIYYCILDLCADFTDEEKQKINLAGFKDKYPTVYSDTDGGSVTSDDVSEVTAIIDEHEKETENA